MFGLSVRLSDLCLRSARNIHINRKRFKSTIVSLCEQREWAANTEHIAIWRKLGAHSVDVFFYIFLVWFNVAYYCMQASLSLSGYSGLDAWVYKVWQNGTERIYLWTRKHEQANQSTDFSYRHRVDLHAIAGAQAAHTVSPSASVWINLIVLFVTSQIHPNGGWLLSHDILRICAALAANGPATIIPQCAHPQKLKMQCWCVRECCTKCWQIIDINMVCV